MRGESIRLRRALRTRQVVHVYEEQCARSRDLVKNSDLDSVRAERVREPHAALDPGSMIEETARHNGHADIIRELIRGRTGE